MGAQADILAYIAGGGANKIAPYGDVEKEQLALQETRAKAKDLKVAEEQRQRQAKDVKLLNDSFTGARGDLKETRDRYIKNGGGTAVLMAWEDANSKVRKAIGEADEQTAKATALQATQLAQAMTGYRALPPEQQAQVRPHVEAELRQAGHLGPGEQLDDAHAALLEARGRAFADITSRITADSNAKKAAQDALKTADDIANSQALRPGLVSKGQSDATIAASAAAAAPELQDAAIKRAAADALKIQQETEGTTPISPEQQVRADQAAATLAQAAARDAATNANAQANTRVAQGRLAEEVRKNNMATAEMLNSGLAHVPKNLQNSATAAATKVGEAAAEAQQAADDMKTFIDLARGGNKVAYAYAPTEGVLTLNTGRGVKRVNMAEIKSYGGSGSTVDKIQGWLGGHVAGASIPPDILDAMEALHKSVGENAITGAQRKLDVVNQMYGSDFKLPGATSSAAAPAGTEVKARPKAGERRTYTDAQGKSHTVTFLGGDVNDKKNWKE